VMALPLSVKATDMMKDPHIGLDHWCGEKLFWLRREEDGALDIVRTRAGPFKDVGLASTNRKSF